jgi:hypothetical protein
MNPSVLGAIYRHHYAQLIPHPLSGKERKFFAAFYAATRQCGCN